MFSQPEPLLREIERSFPDRPFSIELWNGRRLPATETTAARCSGCARRGPSPTPSAHPASSASAAPTSPATSTQTTSTRSCACSTNWKPPPLEGRAKARLGLAALRAIGLMRPPPIPAAELRPRGERHTRERDRRAVRHHYDVSNEFFALFLDRSMTYSCAIFSRGAETLEEAQRTKLDLVCTKLRLREGERVLDIGSGWGSFAIHAAREYGARVLGITLSEPQARLARELASEAGVGDRVEFRVADYRELRRGGLRRDRQHRHGRARRRGADRPLREPPGRAAPPRRAPAQPRHRPPPPHRPRRRPVLRALRLPRRRAAPPLTHDGGARARRLRARPHRGLPRDYAETLRHWAERLDANRARAEQLAGPERLRVWRLYLRAARNGFLTGFTSIFQVEATKPGG